MLTYSEKHLFCFPLLHEEYGIFQEPREMLKETATITYIILFCNDFKLKGAYRFDKVEAYFMVSFYRIYH